MTKDTARGPRMSVGGPPGASRREPERPKAEGERPKAEGERPKAEGDCPFSLSIYLSLSAATPLSFIPRVQTGQSGRVTSFD